MSKPKTPAEMAAWRCQSACEYGRDVIDGTPPGIATMSSMTHAMFLLLRAVEDLSKQVALIGKAK